MTLGAATAALHTIVYVRQKAKPYRLRLSGYRKETKGILIDDPPQFG